MNNPDKEHLFYAIGHLVRAEKILRGAVNSRVWCTTPDGLSGAYLSMFNADLHSAIKKAAGDLERISSELITALGEDAHSTLEREIDRRGAGA